MLGRKVAAPRAPVNADPACVVECPGAVAQISAGQVDGIAGEFLVKGNPACVGPDAGGQGSGSADGEALQQRDIYLDVDLRAKAVLFPGDVCCVTFDSYTDLRTLDRPGFAEHFFIRRGISAVHVISRNNDWWQYESMDLALEAVRVAVSGYARVVTYGTSMGAYAALRFAPKVGAHAAFAISPQYSLNPVVVPFETRWGQEARSIVFRPEIDGTIVSDVETFLAYDPRSTDALHARLIAGDMKVEEIRLPFAGHYVPAVLSECGLLGPMLTELETGAPDISRIGSTFRRNRWQSPSFIANIVEKLAARRPETAIRLARRGAALAPRSPSALKALAGLLGRRGDHEEALVHYRDIAGLSSRNVAALHDLSVALSRLSRFEEAMDVALECVGRAPEVAMFSAWVAHLLRLQKNGRAALPHAERAVQLDPDNPASLKALADLFVELGDHHLAVARYRQVSELLPGDTNALHDLSYGLALASRLEEALDLAVRAAEIAPHNPALAFWVAHLHRTLKQDAAALPYAERAHELDPGNASYRDAIDAIRGSLPAASEPRATGWSRIAPRIAAFWRR